LLRLCSIALLLCVTTPALAAELGTCLTEAGSRLAPRTDPIDPACGEDCGADVDEEAETLCSTDDGACGVDDREPMALRMPAPTGPRCLEPGPTCAPGNPFHGAMTSGVVALAPAAVPSPRRASGTLPGAGSPIFDARPHELRLIPDSPPPRA